jgi:hypothetical protein
MTTGRLSWSMVVEFPDRIPYRFHEPWRLKVEAARSRYFENKNEENTQGLRSNPEDIHGPHSQAQDPPGISTRRPVVYLR